MIEMFINRLKEHYEKNTPIFRKEIRALFPELSGVYVYQLIKKACEDGDLVHYSMGIYYLPDELPYGLGRSTITGYDIALKRFIMSDNNYFGIFSGEVLANSFCLTSQVAATIEIVTNNETTNSRKVTIGGMNFILHKSRVEITKDNVNTYCLLELFTENNDIEKNERALQAVNDYVTKYKITRDDILSLLSYFPKRVGTNLLLAGVI